MAEASCSFQKPKRLLKCFCGCKDLTEEEVKLIYMLSTYETLRNQQASDLFKSYLKSIRSRRMSLRGGMASPEVDGDSDHKSEVEKFLDIYEICEELLKSDRIIDEDDIEKLSDSGIQYYLEERLTASMNTGILSNIQECLRSISNNCHNEITASSKYSDFKDALLKKLNKRKHRK